MDRRTRLAERLTGRASPRAASAAPRLRAGSALGRTIGRLSGPLAAVRRIPRGVGIAAAALLLIGSAGFGAVRGGHLAELAEQLRDGRDALANAVGFRITTIALSGVHQLSGDQVLAAAGITARSSLPFLDAGEVRARLKANPWIADATVLKLYPGRLTIAIVERQAFALWQMNGKVAVIAADGTALEPYDGSRFTDLPLVVGTGAQTRAKDVLGLLERYPLVREKLRAAVLVAERRWDLVLDNGPSIKLPEQQPAQALDRLVQLDRDDKILSRDITVVDLRLPDRVTVQLSDEAAAARQDAMKAKTAKKKAGAA